MDKAKRTAIRIERIDGSTGVPVMIGDPKDLLLLAGEALTYIIDENPDLWAAAKAMTAITLEATKPRTDRVWDVIFRIGKGIIIGLAAFGCISIGFFLKLKGVV